MDNNHHVIEGTMSNLFIVKNNCLYTPVLDQSGVNGILRNIIMALAAENQIALIEKHLLQEDVIAADEVFVTNSIFGIWPVKQVDMQVFQVGKVCKTLQGLFSEYKQQVINVC